MGEAFSMSCSTVIVKEHSISLNFQIEYSKQCHPKKDNLDISSCEW